MALGALIIALAYLLLAALVWFDSGQRAGWIWLVIFFVVFTFGELFILPTGLGLFARLAPLNLGATTVASWFLITFTGSLCAGLVGSFWSRMAPAQFFMLLAGLAAVAAVLLRSLASAVDRVDNRPN